MRPLAVKLPLRDTVLLPACCLHFPLGEMHLIRKWVEELRTTPNAYGLLLGDSFDAARTHYRSHLRTYTADENSQESLDTFMKEEVRDLAKILKPVAKKILGLVHGNHYWQFLDGTTSEQYLCQVLEIPYLGATAAIRLDFYQGPKDKGAKHQLVLVGHHHGGTSGGRTTGGDVAALQRGESSWDADIYVFGHTHRRVAFKDAQMTLTKKGEPRVRERSKVFIRAGAFLKGYREDSPNATQPHRASYAEEKFLRPTDLGWVKLEILFKYGQPGSGGGKLPGRGDIRAEMRVSY